MAVAIIKTSVRTGLKTIQFDYTRKLDSPKAHIEKYFNTYETDVGDDENRIKRLLKALSKYELLKDIR